jgi:hypothetical protein
MANGYQLLVDRDCELFPLLENVADTVFDDVSVLEPGTKSICVIGRTQTCLAPAWVRHLTLNPDLVVIFCDTAEGADNTKWHLQHLGLEEPALAGKLLLITGGELELPYQNLVYHSLISRTINRPYNRNIQDHTYKIYSDLSKPYQFLFLNGRTRRHRKYLIERFEQLGILERALWTDLLGWGYLDEHLRLWDGDVNLMLRPRAVKYLPPEYELPESRSRVGTYSVSYGSEPSAKFNLFDGEWRDGDIYPLPYQHTYFSLVTETMFEYPYTFITEKIVKPILIGHPWIASANRGFYRSLRDMGFRTFGHLIDESFDAIDNDQDRVERVAEIVQDLCRNNPADFLRAAQDVCVYNQHHIREYARREQQGFLTEFFNFIHPHIT